MTTPWHELLDLVASLDVFVVWQKLIDELNTTRKAFIERQKTSREERVDFCSSNERSSECKKYAFSAMHVLLKIYPLVETRHKSIKNTR